MRPGRDSRGAEASSRLLRGLGLFACGIVLAGCAPERTSRTDPLLGGLPLPRNASAASATTPVAVAPPTPLVGPPPLPPSSAALSPAALAAGPTASDNDPLRIGPPPIPVSGPPQPSVLTSAPHEGTDPWHSAAPTGGATLRSPEAISDAPNKPIAMIAPPTVGTAPAPGIAPPAATRDSYADLQDKLSQRKVVFQSLEGPDDKDVWRFSCGVPSRDQAGAVHRIELSAAGDHGLNAMRAVITQIDGYQR